MARKVSALGDRALGQLRNVIRRVEDTRRPRRPDYARGPRPREDGGAAPRVAIGVITGHNGGTSQERRYHAQGIDDPSALVLDGRPLDVDYDPETAVLEAEAETPCTLVKLPVQGGDEWFIWRIWDEYGLTEVCDPNSGAGSDNEGIASASESGRVVSFRTRLTLVGGTFAVTSGTQTKINVGKLYTFPAGVILIDMVSVKNLATTTTGPTNNTRIGFGSAAASGSGTTLTGTEDDWVADAMTGAIPWTLSPISQPSKYLDGRTTTAKEFHLNLCPTANWNASGNVLFTAGATIDVLWRLAGGP